MVVFGLKRIPLIIVLLALFVSVNHIISPYNITPNQSFTYDIKEAKRNEVLPCASKKNGPRGSGEGQIYLK